MSESDQDQDEVNDISDAVTPFDQDRADVPALHARLERLQRLLVEQEPTYTAAVHAYNAALRAAYDQFYLAANVYQRASETVSRICSTLTFEMRVDDEAKEEESPGWEETEEGRKHARWIEVWDDFDNAISDEHIGLMPGVKPRKVPLSEQIAALPRRPEDINLPAIGRAIDPAVQASVESSWRRIDSWLSEKAPALAPKMRAGATPGRIAEVEATLGVELPESVRASYLIHDGSDIMSLFPSGEYASLDGLLREAKMWKEILEDDPFEGEEVEVVGPVQRVHFHPRWFFLVTNGGGDGTVIDLAPAEGGEVGQLVDFSHETGPECVAAPGLAEYLAYLADGMEAGAASVEDEYLVWHDGRDTPRSGYVVPKEGPGASSP